MGGKTPNFAPEQVQQAARNLLTDMIASSVLDDEREAAAWVVETVDPDLDTNDPSRRRLLGPFDTAVDAIVEAHRYETEVNPEVHRDGFSPLKVAILPILRP